MFETQCSECFTKVTINLNTGVTTARKPSNGVRGKAFVAAHDVHGIAVHEEEYPNFIMWDCPVCGYADSSETDLD